ncbi:magnesium-transporting ATPase [Lactobacillus plantarum] [Lactiplantibacillus mudanjiangensis]|uniref:Magnesium-transporting ATPase [Lactobacillus plantarum] n=1 Tax=Lactiplantibacillus mudanjiangensis TaxID=1296538 RepID=A0A660DYY0_9LACO|nr:magnesium-transporting ATPase [Lactobacillus plantarum] [Lactiplantibacillus mudanjiangensis]
MVTAKAIAEEIGILTPELQAISGDEVRQLSDEELTAQIDQIAVYARVVAREKSEIGQG